MSLIMSLIISLVVTKIVTITHMTNDSIDFCLLVWYNIDVLDDNIIKREALMKTIQWIQ